MRFNGKKIITSLMVYKDWLHFWPVFSLSMQIVWVYSNTLYFVCLRKCDFILIQGIKKFELPYLNYETFQTGQNNESV